MSDLATLEERALAELRNSADAEGLRAWNTRYLGPKGEVNQALGKIKEIPQGQRREYGQKANQVKETLTRAYEEVLAAEKERELARSLATETLDVSLPGRPVPRGRLHVSTQTLRA